ncbi:MAG: 50S ribosomal protein L23, partial [Bryobacteraceae bacterium]
MKSYEVIRRPLLTEKGVAKKESELTLVFEVNPRATKTQIRAA